MLENCSFFNVKNRFSFQTLGQRVLAMRPIDILFNFYWRFRRRQAIEFVYKRRKSVPKILLCKRGLFYRFISNCKMYIWFCISWVVFSSMLGLICDLSNFDELVCKKKKEKENCFGQWSLPIFDSMNIPDETNFV